jgi:hypothetical protein
MDKIINVLLLIIIFVFDPLAISLVVAANFAFEKAYPKKKYRENLYGETLEVKKELDWDAAEKRMDIIGQNGNSGEHYGEFDLDKDGILSQSEADSVVLQITKIKSQMGGNLNPNSDMGREVKRLENFLEIAKKDNDLTITY